MSEWITDRLPTKEDGMSHGCVWILYAENYQITTWNLVRKNEAWMPIPNPEPYVAPKPRFITVMHMYEACAWAVYDGKRYFADGIPTREAAERIAAIYNEVMS